MLLRSGHDYRRDDGGTGFSTLNPIERLNDFAGEHHVSGAMRAFADSVRAFKERRASLGDGSGIEGSASHA